MQRYQRLRRDFIEALNPARLRTRLIMGKQASRGEIERILLIYHFSRFSVRRGMKTRPAAGGIKTLLKQTRRARVLLRGTGPENALLAFDARIAQTSIIGN